MSKPRLSDLEVVLSDAELDSLERFNSDEHMQSAVEKALLFDVYYNGTLKEGEKPNPHRNSALSIVLQQENAKDEKIGRDVRTWAEAIRIVTSGFEQIKKLKKVEDKQDNENPAV